MPIVLIGSGETGLALSEIVSQVQHLTGDDSGVVVTTAKVAEWANNAQIDIVRKTEVLTDTFTWSVAVGTDEYQLPGNYLRLQRVTLDGLFLSQTSFQELDYYQRDRDSDAATSTPDQFYIRGKNLVLWPLPAAAGTDNLKLFYARLPNIVSTGTDVLELPRQMMEDVVRFCTARANEMLEELEFAHNAMEDYDVRVGLAREEAHASYSDSYPSIRSLPEDSGTGWNRNGDWW